MIRTAFFITLALFSTTTFAQADTSILPKVPDGVQAISLLGEELKSGEPGERVLENLAAARAEYENDPNDADNIIWLGLFSIENHAKSLRRYGVLVLEPSFSHF